MSGSNVACLVDNLATRAVSRSTDNCGLLSTASTLQDIMKYWIDNTFEQLRYGEALLASGVDGLYQGWKASTEALGKLCTGGADRWQSAIRQVQSQMNFSDMLPPNLADILRSRTST
jgi:hypothetical protein